MSHPQAYLVVTLSMLSTLVSTTKRNLQRMFPRISYSAKKHQEGPLLKVLLFQLLVMVLLAQTGEIEGNGSLSTLIQTVVHGQTRHWIRCKLDSKQMQRRPITLLSQQCGLWLITPNREVTPLRPLPPRPRHPLRLQQVLRLRLQLPLPQHLQQHPVQLLPVQQLPLLV